MAVDGETDNRAKKERKRRPMQPHAPTLKDDLTLITHVTIVTFVVTILYMCFARPVEFFTWHPFFMSLGWMLLMFEGVLVISKENPVGRYLGLTHDLKNRWHWILITAASVFILAGSSIAFISKENNNKQHFTSWHGLLGLLANLSCVPSIVNGTATLWDVKLKRWIKPNTIKLIHQCCGTLAVIFGGICLMLSIYTNWFARASGGNKYLYIVCINCTLYSFAWTLQRPLLKCYRKLFKKNENKVASS